MKLPSTVIDLGGFDLVLEKEMSFINLAEELLHDSKEPMDLYDLFDYVVKTSKSNASEDEFTRLVTMFYADLTSSAKFVYLGANRWDLKEHHSVELWEKDGSYYNEYKEVHDEFMESRLEKAQLLEEKHQAMLEARKEKEAMIQATRESQDSPALEMNEPEEMTVTFEDSVPELEGLEEEIEIFSSEDIVEDESVELKTADGYEEDFDEEKYNEIMDAYEDQYEDS